MMKLIFVKIWYLSAIEIIDTQVARRGRQYHRNPPPYKNRPTKKNRIYKIKDHHHHNPPQPTPPPRPTHPTPKPNPRHHIQPNPTQPKEKKSQLAKADKLITKQKMSNMYLTDSSHITYVLH